MRQKARLFVIMTLVLNLVVFTFLPSVSAASNYSDLDSEVIDRADYTTDKEFEKNLNQLLNDPKVIDVTALDTRNSLELEPLVEEDMTIQPMSVLLPYITNVRRLGDQTQNTTLATVWADPGIAVSLTNSWGRTATYSSTTGIKDANVSAGLSFTVGRSYTISYSGSYTAPRTYNGKSVKQVRLYANPVRERYTFDVYEPTKWSLNPFADPYQKTGTGTAYKPIGVSYTKTYIYK